MEFDMDQGLTQQLVHAAKLIGITLNNIQITQFSNYYQELCLWNTKINLVSFQNSEDLILKHFIDSISSVRFIDNPAADLLDIGSGAGFPGIPIKIVLPSLSVTLLEASRKKASFLKHIVRTLNLTNITVMNQRIEEFYHSTSDIKSFQFVISRATFKLSELITHAGPVLAPGGILLALKSKNIAAELVEAEAMAQSSDLYQICCHDFLLPENRNPRKIIIYKKTS